MIIFCFLKVATAVQEQQERREESSKRMERANLGLTVLVKKLERSLFVSEIYCMCEPAPSCIVLYHPPNPNQVTAVGTLKKYF